MDVTTFKKITKKQTLHIFFDVETHTINKNDLETLEIRPYLVGWVGWVKNDKPPKKINYCVNGAEGFINYLLKHNATHNLIIYAYNIKYDLLAIVTKYFPKLEFADFYQEKNRMMKFTTGTTMQKNFVMFKYRNKGILNVDGVDLMSWDRTKSLKDWTTFLNIKVKGELEDYEKYDCVVDCGDVNYTNKTGVKKTVALKDELDYLKTDVLSLFSIFKYIHKIKWEVTTALKLKVYKPFFGNTSGAFAKWVVNQWMDLKFDELFRPEVEPIKKDCIEQVKKTEEEIEQIRKDESDVYKCLRSSNGGFTSYNKKRLIVENERVCTYDVNSMYSKTMSGYLPIGKKFDSKKDLKNPITWYTIEFTKIEWKEKYKDIKDPPLAIKKKLLGKDSYLWKGYYDFIDKYAIHDIKITKVEYQESEEVLKKLIEIIYQMRLDTDNEFLKAGLKLILNCIYGKTCENPYLEERFYNFQRFVTAPIPSRKIILRMCLTGVYIVNYSRVVLLQALVNEIDNENTFLQSDTDSIKIIQRNKPKFAVSGKIKKLGEWKQEESYTHFYQNGRKKKYLMYNEYTKKKKFAMSGISRPLQKILYKMPIELLVSIFNPNHNYVFIAGCKKTKTSIKYSQTIILSSNSQFNAAIPPTHYLSFTKNEVKSGLWKNYKPTPD